MLTPAHLAITDCRVHELLKLQLPVPFTKLHPFTSGDILQFMQTADQHSIGLHVHICENEYIKVQSPYNNLKSLDNGMIIIKD